MGSLAKTFGRCGAIAGAGGGSGAGAGSACERRGCGEGGGDGQRPGQWGESHEEIPLQISMQRCKYFFISAVTIDAAANAL